MSDDACFENVFALWQVGGSPGSDGSLSGLLLVVMTFLIALMLWVIGLLMRFAETGEGRVVTPAPCATSAGKEGER